jgi:hypothetical protein
VLPEKSLILSDLLNIIRPMLRFFSSVYVGVFLGGCVPDLGCHLTDQPYLAEDIYLDLNQVPTREEAMKPRGKRRGDMAEEPINDRQKLESEKRRLQRELEVVRRKTLPDEGKI